MTGFTKRPRAEAGASRPALSPRRCFAGALAVLMVSSVMVLALPPAPASAQSFSSWPSVRSITAGAGADGKPTLTVVATSPDGRVSRAVVLIREASAGWPARGSQHSLPAGVSHDSALSTYDDWTFAFSDVFTGLKKGTRYEVRVYLVRRSDNAIAPGSSSTRSVTMWDDPDAPTAFQVTAGDANLTVSWQAPADTGGPGATLTGYDLEYKETSAPDQPAATSGDPSTGWVDAAHAGTATIAEIAGLTNRRGYDVRVRATNAVGASSWLTGAGTPDPTATRTVSLSKADDPPEGSPISVTATLSAPFAARDLSIPVTVTAPDGLGSLTSITIKSGETTGTGTITTVADLNIEGESATVELGTLPPGVTAGASRSVTVTVEDREFGSSSAGPPPLPGLRVRRMTTADGKGVLGLETESPDASAYSVVIQIKVAGESWPTRTAGDSLPAGVLPGPLVRNIASFRGFTTGTEYVVRSHLVTIGDSTVGTSSSPEFSVNWGVPDAPRGPLESLWSTVLTVDADGGLKGCDNDAGGLDGCSTALVDDSFSFGGASYQVTSLHVEADGDLVMDLDAAGDSLAGFAAFVRVGGNDGIVYPLSLNGSTATWSGGPSWTDDQRVEISIDGYQTAPVVTARDAGLDVLYHSVGDSWATPHEFIGGNQLEKRLSVTGYEVQYKETSAADQAASTPNDPSTGWVDGTAALHPSCVLCWHSVLSGLTNGESHDVRVRARNSLGASSWATASGTPLGVVPAVTSATAGAAGGAPTLTVVTVNPDANTYELVVQIKAAEAQWPVPGRSHSLPDGVSRDGAASTADSHVFTGLARGASYDVRAHLVASQIFTSSAAQRVRTWDVPSAPGAPDDVVWSHTFSVSVSDDDGGVQGCASRFVPLSPCGAGKISYRGETLEVFAVYVEANPRFPPGPPRLNLNFEPENNVPGALNKGRLRLGGVGGVVYPLSKGRQGGNWWYWDNPAPPSWTDGQRVTVELIAPADHAAVTAGDASLTVGWEAPKITGGPGVAVTGYGVEYKETLAADRAAITAGDPSTGWVDAAHSGTARSAEITGLTNGTGYDVRVRAENAVGGGPWLTGAGTPVAPPVPGITSVVAGEASGNPILTVVTTNPDSSTYDVVVQVKTSATTGWPARATSHSLPAGVARTSASTTTRHVLTVAKGTAYDVRAHLVAKSDSTVVAASSPESSVTSWDDPGVPTRLVVTADDKKLGVSWMAPADTGGTGVTLTGYDVEYKESSAADRAALTKGDPSTGWVEAGHSGTGTSTAITSLSNGTGYDVRVRAKNAVGESSWLSGDGTPETPVPGITSVTAGAASGTPILTVVTSNPSPGDYDVVVQIKKSDAVWPASRGTSHQLPSGVGHDAAASSAGADVFTGLEKGAVYNIRAHLKTKGATPTALEASSAATTATTWDVPGALSAPTVTAGVGKLTVNWAAPATAGGTDAAVTGYDLGYKESSAPDRDAVVWDATLTVDQRDTIFGCESFSLLANCDVALDDDDFSLGDVDYTVRAISRNSQSGELQLITDSDFGDLVDYSLVIDGSSFPLNHELRNFSAARWGSSLSWSDGQKVRVSLVRKDRSPAAGWVDAGHTGTATTAEIAPLTGGTAYDVRVRATNGVKPGSAWAAVQGTPLAGTFSVTASASAAEGASASLTVTLSENAPASGVEFTVTADYTNPSTATSADVGSITSPVTVASGQTTATVTVPLVDDDLDENDETFTVTIATSASGWAKEGAGKDTATVTILDDDTAGVAVSVSELEVAKGATGSYTVALTSKPAADVTVTPSSSSASASFAPASYTFTPVDWATAREFTVSGVAVGTSVITHVAASSDVGYRIGAGGNPSVDVRVLSTDATLSALSASAGSLSPAFASGTVAYALAVPSGTAGVTLTASTTHSGASMTVGLAGGAKKALAGGEASDAFPLGQQPVKIVITVTAQDGTTTAEYVVTVERAELPVPVVDSVRVGAAVGGGLPFLLVSYSNPDTSLYTVVVQVREGAAGWAARGVAGAGGGLGPGRTYVGTGLKKGTEYWVRAHLVVKSTNSVVEASSAETKVVTWDDPGPPTGLVVAGDASRLVLSWAAPVDTGGASLAGYEVEYKAASAPDRASPGRDPSTGWVDVVPGPATTTATIGGLVYGTSYDVRVRATNAAGASSWVSGTGVAADRSDASLKSLGAALTDAEGTAVALTPRRLTLGSRFTVRVDDDVTEVKVTAVPTVAGATVTIDGASGGSKVVALGYGDNTVTVVVTALDGTTAKTYTIVAKRAYPVPTITSAVAGAHSDGTPKATVVTSNPDSAAYTVVVQVKEASAAWPARAAAHSLPAGVSRASSSTADSHVLVGLAKGTAYLVRAHLVTKAATPAVVDDSSSEKAFTAWDDPGAPGGPDTAAWSTTLTVDAAGGLLGCDNAPGGLDDCADALGSDGFSFGGKTLEVTELYVDTGGNLYLKVATADDAPVGLRAAKLRIGGAGGVSYPLTGGLGKLHFWGGGPSWTDGQAVQIELLAPSSTPKLTVGHTKLTVGWFAPADPGGQGAAITGYEVQYKQTSAADQAAVTPADPSTGWVDASHTGTATTVEITGLTNGTAYDVRVRAANAVGNSVWITGSATPADTRPVPVVHWVRAGVYSDKTPRLTFSYANPDSNVYEVVFQIKKKTDAWGARGTDHDLFFFGTGLEKGTEYLVRAHLVVKSGRTVIEASSNEVSVVTWDDPGPPTALMVTGGAAKLALSWTAPADVGGSGASLTGYDVAYKTTAAADVAATTPGDPSTGWVPVSHSGTGTTVEVTGLTAGRAYDVRVRATNATGESSWVSGSGVAGMFFALSAESGSVGEGGLIRLLVEMSPRPAQEVVVPLLRDGRLFKRVRLTPSNPAAYYIVRAAQNEFVTGDVTYVFSLGGLPDGYGADLGWEVLAGYGEVSVTVVDDDAAALVVSVSPARAQAGEQVTFTGRLLSARSIEVGRLTADSDAASSVSFHDAASGVTLTFAGSGEDRWLNTAAERTATATWTVPDPVAAPGTSFSFVFKENPGERARLAAKDFSSLPVSVRVAHSEPAKTASLADAQAVEGADLEVVASFAPAVTGAGGLPIPLSFVHGWTSSADLGLRPSSFTADPGATSATYTLGTRDDTLVEPDETLAVSFGGNLGHGYNDVSGPATLTITDNDSATLVVSATADGSAVAHGDTVTDLGVALVFSAALSLDGSATAVVPHRSSRDVVLNASVNGRGVGSFRFVDTNRDGLLTGDELNATGTVAWSTNGRAATLSVTPLGWVTHNINAEDFTVNARGQTRATGLTAAAGDTRATLSWQWPDTAPSVNGWRVRHRDRSDPSGAYTVQTLADPAARSFTFTGLVNGRAYGVQVAPYTDGPALWQGTSLVLPAELGTFAVTAATTATEGANASLTITLSENAPASGVEFTVTADYTNPSTATSADVGSITSPVTVASGQTTATVTVPLVDDDLDENDETFTVTIATSASGWAKEGAGKDTATVTILDDDTAGVAVSVSELEVAKGATGSYTVALTSKPAADVTVTPSSSSASASFAPASYTFTPVDWATAREFTVSGVAVGTSVITHVAASSDVGYRIGAGGNPSVDVRVLSTDATLSALSASAGSLSPAFASGTVAYALAVPSGTAGVTLTASTTHSGASMTVGLAGGAKKALAGGEASDAFPLGQQPVKIVITVTAQDGTTAAEYVVTVNRAVLAVPVVDSVRVGAGTGGLPFLLVSYTNPDSSRYAVVVQVREGSAEWAARGVGGAGVGLGPGRTYVGVGLKKGTAYGVRAHLVVKGTNSVVGASSAETRVVTWDDPGPPTDLVVAGGDSKLVLSWAAPADTGGVRLAGYEVEYKADSAPDRASPGRDPSTGWVDVVPGPATAAATIGGLVNGTSYDVRVRAKNAAGASSWVSGTGVAADPTDASLKSLEVALTDAGGTPVPLTPRRLTLGSRFTVRVDDDVTEVKVSAVPTVAGAAVTVDGTPGAAKVVALGYGDNTVTVVVTAVDGTTAKTYTITAKRAYPVPAVVSVAEGAHSDGTPKATVVTSNPDAAAYTVVVQVKEASAVWPARAAAHSLPAGVSRASSSTADRHVLTGLAKGTDYSVRAHLVTTAATPVVIADSSSEKAFTAWDDPGAPGGPDTAAWSTTLTVDADGGLLGCDNAAGGLDDCADALSSDQLSFGGKTLQVTELYVDADGNLNLKIATAGDAPAGLRAAKLRIGGNNGVSYPLTKGPGKLYFWTGGPTWTDDQQITVELLAPSNTPTVTAGDAKLTVGWVAPADPGGRGAAITGYGVAYKESSAADRAATVSGDASTGWVAVAHSGTGTSVEITSLTNAVDYDVRVRAENAVGESAWVSASGTPLPDKYFALSAESGSVGEGGLIRLLVEMSPRPAQEVVVPLLRDGRLFKRVRLTPSNPAAYYIVRAAQNEFVTGDVTYVFSLGGLPDGYGADLGWEVLAGYGEVSVTVVDDDAAALVVSVSPARAQAGEQVTFTGRLLSARSIEVGRLTADSDAASSVSFHDAASGVTLTFAGSGEDRWLNTAAERTATATWTVPDPVAAPGTSFSFVFKENPGERARLAAKDFSSLPVSVRVAHSEPAKTASLADAQAVEGADLEVVASFAPAVTGAGGLPIPLSFVHGWTSSADLGLRPSSFTADPGATSATYTLGTRDDTLVEPDETLAVSFGGNLGHGYNDVSGPATLTITDNDSATLVVSATADGSAVAHGDTVTDLGVALVFSAALSLDGSATAVVPHRSSRDVVLNASVNGRGVGSFRFVDTNRDGLLTGDELNATGTVAWSTNGRAATLSVTPLGWVTHNINAEDFTVNARGQTRATGLTAAAGDTRATLSWQWPDTAPSVNGWRVRHRDRSDPSGAYTVQTLADPAARSFTFTGLVNGRAYGVQVAPYTDGPALWQGTSLVLPAELGTFAVTAATTATEGANASLTITLSENAPASGVEFTVTADYTNPSTATSADVGSITSPVTVASGQTTATVTVPLVDDDLDENDETFTVTIAVGDSRWAKAGPGQDTATITITDNDDPKSANANLSGLTATSSTAQDGTYTSLALSPAFDAAKTSYAASVLNSVGYVKLTPTVADTGKATVKAGKAGSALSTVMSGSETSAIALAQNADNAITVTVTAENGTEKDYTVTVTTYAVPTLTSVTAGAVGGKPALTVVTSNPDSAGFDVVVQIKESSGGWPASRATSHQLPDGVSRDAAASSAGSDVFTGFEKGAAYTVRAHLVSKGATPAANPGSSPSVEATTWDVPGAPPAPTATAGVGKLTLRWAAPTDAGGAGAAVTGYDVEYKETSAADRAATTTGDPSTGWVDAGHSGTGTRAEIAGLTGGTSYDVRVRARNGIDPGSAWAAARGTPQAELELAFDAVASEEAAGERGQTVRVTATLTEAAAAETTVALSVDNSSTATRHKDYSWFVPRALTIAVGETSVSTMLTVFDDDIAEDSETIVVDARATRTEEGVARTIRAQRQTLTIEDDDTAGVLLVKLHDTGVTGDDWARDVVTAELRTVTALTVSTVVPKDTYSVRLASEPTADVTIAAASVAPGVAVVSGGPLTFTASDWNRNQTLTVTGVASGATLISHISASSDPKYDGVFMDVAVTVTQGHFVPGVPRDVVAANPNGQQSGQITVAWRPPADDGGDAVTGYDVEYKESAAEDRAAATPGDPRSGWVDSGHTGSGTTTQITGLDKGASYEIRVRAVNSVGPGEWSASAMGTTPEPQEETPPEETPPEEETQPPEEVPDAPAEVPGPVTGLALSATEKTVTVTWQAPESGGAPDGYIVQLKPVGGGSGKTHRPKAGKLTTTFRNLEPGTAYKVWVRAQNDAGKGERTHARITLPAVPPR